MQLPGLSFSDFRADSGKSALPGWVPNRANLPDIAFNFAVGGGWTKAGGSVPAASLLTTTRASGGYANDSNGNWSLFGNNAPRITNLGLLIEEQRTNSLRNNSMTGAVVQADNVELLTNGNFASSGTGWTSGTAGGGSVTFAVGTATFIGDGATHNNYIAQQVTGLVVGRSYVVTVSASNSGGMNLYVGNSANDNSVVNGTALVSNGFASASPDRTAFTATATSHWVTIAKIQASSLVLTSVSVQDGERIENGTFTSNPVNASQSTVQNGWQWTIGAGTGTVVYNSGPQTVTITGDGTTAAVIGTMALPTVAGFTYTITADVSGATCNVQAGTTLFGAQLLAVSSGLGTGQKFQFTATSTTSFVSFAKTSAVAATIDNVSVVSAGALPTNWSKASITAGLVLNILALGTTNGVDTIDLQLTGTSAGAGAFQIAFDGSNNIAATYGQTWAHSGFYQTLQADALITTAQYENWTFQGDGVTFIATGSGAAVSPSTIAPLTRVNASQTLTSSLTGFVRPMFRVTSTINAGAVDWRFRLGWPQFEATGVNSTVASAAIAAAGSGGTNGTAVYQVGGGTGTAATLNVTIAGGVLSAVNSVASAGSYTVFPPSPAALTYVSGTGTGLTGATVNLTPTNNAALGFVTSPIRTTAAAATRVADVISASMTPGAAYSLFAKGTPQSPNTAAQPQTIAVIDDGTGSNRSGIRRAATDPYEYYNISGGVSNASSNVGNWLQNTSGKVAGAFAVSDQFMYGAGSAAGAGAGAALPVSPNRAEIGSVAGSQFFNGFVEQVAVWTSQRVPNGQLQSMTT
jgi:hypothetical protein